MPKGSKSAEDVFFSEPRQADPPGCVAIGCTRDATPESLAPDVPLCRTHQGMIRNHPYVKDREAQYLAAEVRAAAAASRAKQQAKLDANRAARDTIQHVVYYAQFHKHIKIGTAQNLTKRLRAMSLHPDSLLAVEPGDQKIEQQRHIMFADERYLRTELFDPSERLLDHIKHVRSLFGDPTHFLVKVPFPTL